MIGGNIETRGLRFTGPGGGSFYALQEQRGQGSHQGDNGGFAKDNTAMQTVDEEDSDDEDYSVIADRIAIGTLDDDTIDDESSFDVARAAEFKAWRAADELLDELFDGAAEIEDDESRKDEPFLDTYPTLSRNYCVNQADPHQWDNVPEARLGDWQRRK